MGNDAYSILIKDICTAYHGLPVLEGFSLQVPEGELLGVFGPNGTGKSTLIKVCLGLVPVASGEVRISGYRMSREGISFIRKLTAYVPQSFDVDRRMPVTAGEVVMMGRFGRMGLFNRIGPGDQAAADDALNMLGVKHLAGRTFGRLSGGEKQRVIVARALAQEPKILLMDEPTNSLDWESKKRICSLIREVHVERKLTTLIVSHDIDLLADTCDRIMLMERGHIIGARDPSEFRHCCRGQRHS
ncbi:MAG: metal ABC transporter ATP-binding protein [bacterium]|jgi:ABC-type Mn2+/Zn2+ transport system ATPase subunit